MKLDRTPPSDQQAEPNGKQVCPICGGRLIEIRFKSQCTACHAIIETCCEGGPPIIKKATRKSGNLEDDSTGTGR